MHPNIVLKSENNPECWHPPGKKWLHPISSSCLEILFVSVPPDAQKQSHEQIEPIYEFFNSCREWQTFSGYI